jgi:hypothetical protein
VTIAVYERLGDVRSRAVTLGEIAGILAGQGEIDEALKLHRENADTFGRLGDVRELLATQWSAAQIYLGQQDFERVAPLITEAYQQACAINALDGVAAIGATLGQLMVRDGQREAGLDVLRRSEAAFRRLKLAAEADQVAGIIHTIEADEGAT